ncbi:tape measure protein [Gordonia phage GodonK]|uniref:Tape measure protein n=1 Tax=Gordonia phage GodonK TaxID=2562192 RepID=A0A4D6E265_9CAUD|nr:tail length tape measure protein [Gordonia phage GodonK]QBZ72706.1 tape measure protein [Gordonia phage GodonK]
MASRFAARGVSVGSAYVVVRALVKDAKKDITKGFQEGFKGASEIAEREGQKSGNRFARAFSKNANKGVAQSSKKLIELKRKLEEADLALVRAGEKVNKIQRQITKNTDDTANATSALNEAIRKAQENLDGYTGKIKKATLAQEDGRIALGRAREELDKFKRTNHGIKFFAAENNVKKAIADMENLGKKAKELAVNQRAAELAVQKSRARLKNLKDAGGKPGNLDYDIAANNVDKAVVKLDKIKKSIKDLTISQEAARIALNKTKDALNGLSQTQDGINLAAAQQNVEKLEAAYERLQAQREKLVNQAERERAAGVEGTEAVIRAKNKLIALSEKEIDLEQKLRDARNTVKTREITIGGIKSDIAEAESNRSGERAGRIFAKAFLTTVGGGLQAIRGTLKALSLLATTAFIAMSGQVAVAGLTTIIASLSQIAGLLAGLPALANAFIAVFATGALAFSGISDAFKEMGKEQQNAAQTAKAVAAAQRQVVSAQRALEDAHEGVADAIDGVTDAEIAAERAHRDKLEAIKDLSDAYKEAEERLEDLDLRVRGAALSEEGAVLRVRRARERLANMPAGSTALDYDEERLNLREALHNLDEVRESNGDLREEYAKARKEGVEGSQEVADGKKKVADAAEAETAAQRNVVQAQRNLANAQERVTEATEDLAEAMRGVSEAANSGGVNKFKEALDKLAPNARNFVLTIKELVPQFKNLRNIVQNNMFAGFSEDVRSLAGRYLPILETGMGKLSTVMNRTIREFVGGFNTDEAAGNFGTLLDRISNMLDAMRPGLNAFGAAWRNLSMIGSEFLGRLGISFTVLMQRFEIWTQNTQNVRNVIERAIQSTKSWFAAIGAIGGALNHIGKIALQSGLMDSIFGIAHSMERVTKSTEGTRALTEFFTNAGVAAKALEPVFGKLLLLISDIGGKLALLGADMAPGFTVFLQGIRNVLLEISPALEKLGPMFSDVFAAVGEQGPAIGQALNSLLIAFAPWFSIISVLARTLLPTVAKVIEAMAPVISALAPVIIGLVVAWKAYNMVLAINTALNRTAAGSWIASKIALGLKTVALGVAKVALIVYNATLGKAILAARSFTTWIGYKKAAIHASTGATNISTAAIIRQTIAEKARAVATKISTAAQWALNTAMRANPIILILSLIVALGAGLVLLYKKNETFRNIVQGAWRGIKNVIGGVYNWLKDNVFPVLKAGLEAIGKAAKWLWEKAIQPAFKALSKVVDFVKERWKLFAGILLVVTGPVGWLIGLVALLVKNFDKFKPVLAAVGNAIKWWWQNITMPALKAIAAIFKWAWDSVIKPVFNALVWFIKNVTIPVITFLWKNVISPAFKAIGAIIEFAWNNVIKPIWTVLVWWIKNVIVPAVMWLWKNIIEPAFKTIGAIIKWVWENVIKPAWESLTLTLDALGKFFKWVWEEVIKPAWDGLGNGISWVIDNVIVPAFNWLKDRLDDVKEFFKTTVDGIGKLWDGLKSLLAKPLRFFVDKVYNPVIAGLWNKVADIVGIDKKLPTVDPNSMNFAKGGVFKTGGVTPGYTPGRDVHQYVSPTGGRLALSGGEAIMRPEWTRAVGGPKAVAQMNKAAIRGAKWQKMQKDIQKEHGYAKGGVFGAQRYAMGGVTPREAQQLGGAAINTSLWRTIKGAFPSAQLNSGMTDHFVDNGYHPRGAAIDIGGPNMLGMNHWIFDRLKNQTAQLIHAPVPPARVVLNSALSGRIPHTDQAGIAAAYGGNPTLGGHGNHIHWAADAPISERPDGSFYSTAGYQLGGIGAQAGGGILGAVMQTIKDQVIETFTTPLRAAINAMPNAKAPYAQLPKKMASKMADGLINKAEKEGEKQDAANPSGSGIGAGFQSWNGPADASVVAKVQKAFAEAGWGEGPEWEAAKWIIGKESTWNPTAVNPSSGAWGLFQFLGSTKDSYYPSNDPDPYKQAQAGARYMRDRYGSPTKAKAFWEANGWYDRGGIIKPGKTLVNNESGKPEALLSNSQWALMRKQADNNAEQLKQNEEEKKDEEQKKLDDDADKKDEEKKTEEEKKQEAEEKRKQAEDEKKSKEEEAKKLRDEARKNPTTENRMLRGIKRNQLDWDAANHWAETTLPQQGLDYARETTKEIAGQFLEPLGLEGIVGKLIDLGFEANKPKDQNGENSDGYKSEYGPSGVEDDAATSRDPANNANPKDDPAKKDDKKNQPVEPNKVADTIQFFGMDPKKVMEEIRREQNKRAAYTSRYVRG